LHGCGVGGLASCHPCHLLSCLMLSPPPPYHPLGWLRYVVSPLPPPLTVALGRAKGTARAWTGGHWASWCTKCWQASRPSSTKTPSASTRKSSRARSSSPGTGCPLMQLHTPNISIINTRGIATLAFPHAYFLVLVLGFLLWVINRTSTNERYFQLRDRCHHACKVLSPAFLVSLLTSHVATAPPLEDTSTLTRRTWCDGC
jgi:hypothetical protein